MSLYHFIQGGSNTCGTALLCTGVLWFKHPCKELIQLTLRLNQYLESIQDDYVKECVLGCYECMIESSLGILKSNGVEYTLEFTNLDFTTVTKIVFFF